MINGNFDKDFDVLFEVYVDLYHQYKKAVDSHKQEIERLEIKLEFKGKH